jgi:replicative DNA helicase
MAIDTSSFLPNNVETEQQIISYLIRNQKEAHRINKKFFFDNYCKLFYENIVRINEESLSCDVNLLYDFVKQQESNVNKEDIQKIFDTYTKFDNIEFLFTKLKDFYISNQILQKVEDIAAKTLDKNSLDIKGIKELGGLLDSDIVSLGDSAGLLTTKDLTKRYREELEKRDSGIRKRSLGYMELNKYVTRPAAAEESSILVGMKGGGKSAYKLNIENNLANQGICVISFNPEMPMLSNVDRWIGIRAGIPTTELMKEKKEQALKTQIERELKRIENIPNFLYYDDAYLDIHLILDRIRKSKQIFAKAGVLPEDEYVFVTFDTFDMVTEFESADPRQIKAGMNKFHRMIVRKEKIHAFLLLQANENKIRGNMFKKPEDLDYFKVGIEDIEGGAAYAAKARIVLSINRPVQMKKQFFQQRMDEWNMENDLMNISCVKQNDGPLFFTQFSFNDNMRIYSHKQQVNHE